MPNFKPKAKKKLRVSDKASVTLDSKHSEKMQEFQRKYEIILPQLLEEKKALKNKLKIKVSLDEQLEIKDRLREIRKEVAIIKKQKNEYLLENSKLIFNYFEKKKDVSNGNNRRKILHSFFSKKTSTNNDLNDEVNCVQQYLTNVDVKFLDINHFIIKHDVCEYCGGELIPVDHEGVCICNRCSKQIPFLIENEKPSYKEPPKEVCFYAYKRINHFREILAQFQAKETTQIPEEVLINIKSQIKKERINLKSITNKNAKDILKKLGYNKYYEHIPFIKDKLGIRPPVMTPALEEKLCNLFMDIQKPYAKHCPDDRVNFLNYYYVLYKMCELLERKEFLPYFPMLKDPVKRIEQDEIWKKICAELKWEFIHTN